MILYIRRFNILKLRYKKVKFTIHLFGPSFKTHRVAYEIRCILNENCGLLWQLTSPKRDEISTYFQIWKSLYNSCLIKSYHNSYIRGFVLISIWPSYWKMAYDKKVWVNILQYSWKLGEVPHISYIAKRIVFKTTMGARLKWSPCITWKTRFN